MVSGSNLETGRQLFYCDPPDRSGQRHDGILAIIERLHGTGRLPKNSLLIFVLTVYH